MYPLCGKCIVCQRVFTRTLFMIFGIFYASITVESSTNGVPVIILIWFRLKMKHLFFAEIGVVVLSLK